MNRQVFSAVALIALGSISGSPVLRAADAAPASMPELEEIVITAHKRTERLADVPVSASVLSASTLTRIEEKQHKRKPCLIHDSSWFCVQRAIGRKAIRYPHR